MKPQPPPVRPRNTLGSTEESDKEQEDEIRVDLRLEFQVSNEILAREVLDPALKGERGVQGMIDFFHKGNQLPDIGIAQTAPRVVPLQLLNQPVRVINADVQVAIHAPQEGSRQFTQFTRRCPGESRELPATRSVNEAILQVDADGRV